MLTNKLLKLNGNIRNEIESDRLRDEVYQRIWDDELYLELIGEFGEWGTIDRIDDFIVEQVETVVKSGNMIILVYYVSFFTQTYFDHESNCYSQVLSFINRSN